MNFELLPNETYESWTRRVMQYEHGRALMKLAQGHDIQQLMEEVSRRIIKKLQHPIIKTLTQIETSSYSVDQSLEDYKRNYLDRVGPKADHIKDN